MLFSSVGLGIAVCSLGVLSVMMNHLWWAYIIAVVVAIPCVIFSFAAASTGRYGYIVGISLSSLANVCTSIGVVCAVMTCTFLSVRVYQECQQGGLPSNPQYAVDCATFSPNAVKYYTQIYRWRPIITAIAVLYGLTGTVLSGITMVYGFFQAQHVRSNPKNWLVSTRVIYRSRSKAPRGVSITSTSSAV